MFVSYAQNLEDVMLWRALSAVEAGTYVDVGAYDPVVCSVTKAFYDRGWRGINIEPVEELHRRFVDERPRDINLGVALAKEGGKLTLYEIPAGLSTGQQEVATGHAEQGREVRVRVVPCTTLDDVLREHRIDEVHFLKIDVEGGERAVLEGAALEEVRPWIVVVEATEPNSPEENHADWEPLLLEKGYEHAYFDGLNRFYVARERAELKPHLAVPPNVFDDYVLYPHLRAQQGLEQHNQRVQALESELASLQQQLEARTMRAQALESEVVALQQQLEARTTQAQALESEAAALQQQLEAARAPALESEVADLRQRLKERTTRAQALENDVAWLQSELQRIAHSRSWRMTAPLRAVMGGVRNGRAAVGALAGKRPQLLTGARRHVLGPAVRLAMRSPKLKRAGIRLLAARPTLKARLLRLAHPGPPMLEHLKFNDLPEPARQIYAELEARFPASQPRA